MRETFVKTLVELAKKDPDIFLITGDLGFKALDPFIDIFPDRFLNVGIAEQNMAGIATGMALEGKKVYMYSIANFPTLRCLEQIRNDICYHDLDVKIVAVGGGFSYGPLGYSHHATEDLAIMRSLPNMTVASPASKQECSVISKQLHQHQHPCYLRLGRNTNDNIEYTLPTSYEFGNGIEVKKGIHKAFITTGTILNFIITKLYNIGEYGIYSFPYVKPIDYKMLDYIVKNYEQIYIVEDQTEYGGLSSAIDENIVRKNLNKTIKSFSLSGNYYNTVGKEDFLNDRFVLSTLNLT